MANAANILDSNLTQLDPLCIPEAGSRVVVAMSGGVDSSVAAHLLAKEGWDALGVSMQVWDYRNHDGNENKATCCSPADFCDARRVADQVGIPYYVVDFEKTFRTEVIDKFIKTYQQGLTPNPCIDCNNKVKFGELRARALGFGCTHVATGHYARVKKSKDGFHLLRGVDDSKDQSYFLYTCKQSELANTLFPIGHFTKVEIRELAKSVGLSTATKAESQDICFISGTVYDFVSKIGGSKSNGGKIVTKDGTTVGSHDGIERFTVGQRKGLGIGGAAEPLYVVDIDPAERKVVIGAKADLEREKFSVSEVNWVTPSLYKQALENKFPFETQAIVQVRSRHRGVKANIKALNADTVEVQWLESWATVSPGQAAVFYDLENQEVLGGGRIR